MIPFLPVIGGVVAVATIGKLAYDLFADNENDKAPQEDSEKLAKEQHEQVQRKEPVKIMPIETEFSIKEPIKVELRRLEHQIATLDENIDYLNDDIEGIEATIKELENIRGGEIRGVDNVIMNEVGQRSLNERLATLSELIRRL
ncbi:hypothetical protein CCY99_03555 [Helicobacter sp. 16-1353]|uniref:hypothetical protein n=1 Tax=Helicobacter sp. 16-1353 TaxID=2004996 RepID=UPI000DCB6F36|nr:hypothetical protein [Helicobacter sp. 16-1353]RAX54436.1 hypothetical protein CCY99_03555 [Helicobacter sp. 16-1353]